MELESEQKGPPNLETRGASRVDWVSEKAREEGEYREAMKGVHAKMWEWCRVGKLASLPNTSSENIARSPTTGRREAQKEKRSDG